MNGRVLVASVLVAACGTAAFADPPDDTGELAEALIAQGWPDLAEDLLARAAQERPLNWSEEAIAASAHLVTLEKAASEIDDPYWRKEALLDLLAQTETFVGRFHGTTAAETRKSDLPLLVEEIFEAIVAAIRRSPDAEVTDTLRTQGEAFFARTDQDGMAREAEAKANCEKDPDDPDREFAYEAASYNVCRTLYLRSLLHPFGSDKRNEMIETALKAYGEFDLKFTDSIFNIYAAIDTGNCLKDLGKPKEALDHLDRAIQVRECYGEKDEKTGRWPIGSRDVADVVAYGMFQKMLVLKDMKRTAEMIAVAEDYDTSMPAPWETQSCISIYRELAEAKLAGGDTKACLDIAAKMQEIDPDGYGGVAGRELLGRIAR